MEDMNTSDQEFFERRGNNSTTLNQLFDDTNLKLENGTYSLKYQPKKQYLPQILITTNNGEETPLWQTRLAKVVSAYKESKSVGKVAVAILQDKTMKTSNIVKIIVYKSRRSLLGTKTVQPTLQNEQCIQHREVYMQFYDDEQNYWSLRFLNEMDEEEFISKLIELGIKIPRDILRPNVFVNFSDDDESDTFEWAEGKRQRPTVTNTKAKVLSRISKVGQALPKLTNSESKSTESDSSDLDVIVPPTTGKMNSTQLRKSATAVNGRLIAAVGATTDANSIISTTSSNQLEHQVMKILISEHRIENSEMRMNMSKLDYKMDKLLAEVKKSQSYNDVTGGAYGGGGVSSAASAPKPDEYDNVIELEEKLLDLKKDNRILKQKLEATQHSDDQLLRHYANELNKLGIDVMPTDHVEDILKKLMARVWQTLEHESTECMMLQNGLSAERRTNKELKSTVTGERARRQSLVNQVAQLKSAKVSALAKLSKSEDLSKSLQQQLSETSKQLERSVESGHAELEGTLKIIMNDLHNDLSDKCKQFNEPLRGEILSLVAKCIKDATIKNLKIA